MHAVLCCQGKKPDWGRDQLKHKDEEDKKGDDGGEHDESEEEEDEDDDDEEWQSIITHSISCVMLLL